MKDADQTRIKDDLIIAKELGDIVVKAYCVKDVDDVSIEQALKEL